MLLKGEEYLEADEIVDLTKQMICSVFAIFHYLFIFYHVLSFLSFVIILILFVIICTLLFM